MELAVTTSVKEGDIGQSIFLAVTSDGVAYDMSAATLVELLLRTPDFEYKTVTATAISAAGGTYKYTPTAATFLSRSGKWTAQVHVEEPGKDWHTAQDEFTVGPVMARGT